MSIPQFDRRDPIDGAIAVPESSFNKAFLDALSMVRIAKRAKSLKEQQSEIAATRQRALGYLSVWIEEMRNISPNEVSTPLKRDCEPILRGYGEERNMTISQANQLAVLVDKHEEIQDELQSLERRSGPMKSRYSNSPIPQELAKAMLWVIDSMGVSLRDSTLNLRSQNHAGTEFEGKIVGKSVSDRQTLFELNSEEGHVILITSMGGEFFADFATPEKSESLTLQPGASLEFGVMLDRLAAKLSVQSPFKGNSEDDLGKTVDNEIYQTQKTLAKLNQFIRSDDEMRGCIAKATSSSRRILEIEEEIRNIKGRITSAEDGIQTLEDVKP